MYHQQYMDSYSFLLTRWWLFEFVLVNTLSHQIYISLSVAMGLFFGLFKQRQVSSVFADLLKASKTVLVLKVAYKECLEKF